MRREIRKKNQNDEFKLKLIKYSVIAIAIVAVIVSCSFNL